MKKYLFLLLVMFMTAGVAKAQNFSQQGVQGIGVNLSYGDEVDNIGLGVKYQYGILDQLRFEGSGDWFFKKNGLRMYDLNANLHYLFPMATDFRLYPLGGLSYTNWKFADFDSKGKIALNLGGGGELDINEVMSVNAEVKYQIIEDHNQFVVGVGLVYHF